MPSRPRSHWERSELDHTLKALLPVAGQDLIDLITRGTSVKFIQAIDKEMVLQSRRLDGLLLAKRDGSPFLLHIEFKPRPDRKVARQVARDGCLAHFMVRIPPDQDRLLPVQSVLLCVEHARGKHPSSSYTMHAPRSGTGLVYTFETLVLRDEDAALHLAKGVPGLMPLIPFMRGCSDAMAEQACQVILNLPEDAHQRSELAAAFLFSAGHAFPEVNWFHIIKEEVLMASQVYKSIAEKYRQEGRQQGRQQGRQEGFRETLLTQLQDRLPRVAPDILAAIRTATSETVLAEVSHLIAIVRDDAELSSRLQELLRPAQ